MADTFIKIARVDVGAGGASTIDFSSIPSTYTDLCLKLCARSDYGAVLESVSVKFNNNTSNLSDRALQGSGSAASSFGNANLADAFAIPGSTATASTFGNGELYLPNYAGSNYKSVSIDSVQETNGTTAYMFMLAGLWSNTAAVNQITLYTVHSSNFVQYSSATLYGILKA